MLIRIGTDLFRILELHHITPGNKRGHVLCKMRDIRSNRLRDNKFRSEDDVERASILLHEAQHLRGRGEVAALAEVWRVKKRLGWTEARYSNTRVWKNTREWTHAALPALFACGVDLESDCDE